MIKPASRVAMYARFSSDNQRTESIDAQIRAMQNYCEQKHYLVVQKYIDEAKSATTDKRPAFQRMIADSKQNLFDIVLVHKLDRFARNRYDSAVYKRELKKNGVTVYSVLENLDDSPESIMLQAVLEGMSEYYSENLGREVMKGMKETALQCKHTGGTPPLGFDVDPTTRHLVINEYEAETVRLIFRMFNAGYGYGAIIDELNRQNRRTKSGKRFVKNSFPYILHNEKYTGVYVFNKASSKAADGKRNSHRYKDLEDQIIIEGGCPAIVTLDEFQKAQHLLSSRNSDLYRSRSDELHLLAGKIFCKDCGRAMVAGKTACLKNGVYETGFRWYKCPTKYTCSGKSIKREYVDHYVIELLENNIFNRKAMKKILKAIKSECTIGADDLKRRIRSIEKQIADVSTQISNGTEAVSRGAVSQTLIDHINSLEQKKSELTAERAKLTTSIMVNPDKIRTDEILSRYSELKQNFTDNNYTYEYREFIHDYIAKVTIGLYDVTVRLRTGLNYFESLDTEYSISRHDLYMQMKHPNR